MIILLLIGLFVIIIGLMILFAPDHLKKFNDYLNKPIFNDQEVFNNRIVFAVVALAVGFLLICTYVQFI
tara:strand:+ start:41 stop:247 length:207 start_codon:yes stop_codon:yes gene_type:complete